MKLKLLLSVICVLLGVIAAFDQTLDTERHLVRWKLEGSYIYANFLEDIEELRPIQRKSPFLRAPPPTLTTSDPNMERKGMWLTRHTPRGKNKWRMETSLTHVLFVGGRVIWMGSPNVPLILKTFGEKEIGRFWSDGINWCHAEFNINYHNTFILEVETPEREDYAIVDKVVLGVMRNLTGLQELIIPCLRAPLDEDQRPDMEFKPMNENEFKRRAPPDEGPPDMENKTSTIITPTPTTKKTSFETAQGAKCDCVCSCSKPTNGSSTTPMSPASDLALTPTSASSTSASS